MNNTIYYSLKEKCYHTEISPPVLFKQLQTKMNLFMGRVDHSYAFYYIELIVSFNLLHQFL